MEFRIHEHSYKPNIILFYTNCIYESAALLNITEENYTATTLTNDCDKVKKIYTAVITYILLLRNIRVEGSKYQTLCL
jgi:hypothetical protein